MDPRLKAQDSKSDTPNRPRTITISVIGDSKLVKEFFSCYMGEYFIEEDFDSQPTKGVKCLELQNKKLITLNIFSSHRLSNLLQTLSPYYRKSGFHKPSSLNALLWDHRNRRRLQGKSSNGLLDKSLDQLDQFFTTAGESDGTILVYNGSDDQSFKILEEIIDLISHKSSALVEMNLDNRDPLESLNVKAKSFAEQRFLTFDSMSLNASTVNGLIRSLVENIWKNHLSTIEKEFDISEIFKGSFKVTAGFILGIVEGDFTGKVQEIIQNNFLIKEMVLAHLEELRKQPSHILDMILELNLKTKKLEDFFAIKRPLKENFMYFLTRKEKNTSQQFTNFKEAWKNDLPALTKQYFAQYNNNSIANQIKNLKLPAPMDTFNKFVNPRTKKYMEIPVTIKGEAKKVYYDLTELKDGIHPVTKELINLRDIQPGRRLMYEFDQAMSVFSDVIFIQAGGKIILLDEEKPQPMVIRNKP